MMTWDEKINVKSASEIALMREAGRINAEALDAVKKLVQPGVTTAELNAEAERILTKYGAYSPFKGYGGPRPFPASICASVNEELVHGIPGGRQLKAGDIISVDCGAVFNGFVGDATILLGVGEISQKASDLIRVTEKALELAIAQMLPGNHTGDVGAAVERYVESQGFYITRMYTGHGVGRQMHEGPQVPNYGKPGTGILLREGMTIALEPMVLVGTSQTKVLRDGWTVVSKDGSLTAHCEHTVAVTANGPEILTLL